MPSPVSNLELGLWLANVVLCALVSWLIAASGAFRRWTWLFCYTSLLALLGIALYAFYFLKLEEEYFWTFWGARAILAICEIGIVWTMVRALIGITPGWCLRIFRGLAILLLVCFSISGLATAALPATFALEITRQVTTLDRWVSLGCSLMFVFVTFSLDAIGMKWRAQILMIGLGFAIRVTSLTFFSWFITLAHSASSGWRTPSILMSISNLVTASLWASAFVFPGKKYLSESPIPATRLEAAINALEASGRAVSKGIR